MDFFKRRLIISILVFVVTLNLDFFLPRLVPGNAAQIFASGTKLPAKEVLLLDQRFRLNQPLYIQYYLYFKGIFSSAALLRGVVQLLPHHSDKPNFGEAPLDDTSRGYQFFLVV